MREPRWGPLSPYLWLLHLFFVPERPHVSGRASQPVRIASQENEEVKHSQAGPKVTTVQRRSTQNSKQPKQLQVF